jgi:uncharacterized OB-fold protein
MSELVANYREGLARGELLIQSCEACGAKQMYPRYRCTTCQSAGLTFVRSSGLGTLLSHTVIRAVPPRGFEDDLPYAVGVVLLDEGVQLLARLRASEDSREWTTYACDQRVQFAPATAQEIERRPVAWFEHADGQGPGEAR